MDNNRRLSLSVFVYLLDDTAFLYLAVGQCQRALGDDFLDLQSVARVCVIEESA